MTRILLLSCLLALPAVAEEPALRVYTLDCGHASLDDGAPASDTGEFDGRRLELADPCFVIQHPKGTLLWDAGLPPEPRSGPGFRTEPGPPIAQQLAKLGLRIDLLAFSHLHFDHVGNARSFPDATWIVNRAEWAWAQAGPAHVSMERTLLSESAPKQLIDGDHDVFGDGTVRILHMPGHTPGSSVLQVQLRKQPLLLSGDLYLQRESRTHAYVPRVNADRAATLASIARFERIAKRTHAHVVIQHDPTDYATLPKPPAYLE